MIDEPVAGKEYRLKRSLTIDGVTEHDARVTITRKATLVYVEEWQYMKDRMWRFIWKEKGDQPLSLKVTFAQPLLKEA